MISEAVRAQLTAYFPDEEPDYLTKTPAEWIPLVEKLENGGNSDDD